MNTQKDVLLQRAIDEEQRNLEEAMQAVRTQPCADDNELASCYESIHARISVMQHTWKRLLRLRQRMEMPEGPSRTHCADCGEEISPRRLEVLPEAVRCAACQAEWEEEQFPVTSGYGASGSGAKLCRPPH